MSKAKSRFPVLTSERLRHLMIGSKLRMEKAELEQVCPKHYNFSWVPLELYTQ